MQPRRLAPEWLRRACRRHGFAISYVRMDFDPTFTAPSSFTVKLCQLVKVIGIPGFENATGYRDGYTIMLNSQRGTVHGGKKRKP